MWVTVSICVSALVTVYLKVHRSAKSGWFLVVFSLRSLRNGHLSASDRNSDVPLFDSAIPVSDKAVGPRQYTLGWRSCFFVIIARIKQCSLAAAVTVSRCCQGKHSNFLSRKKCYITITMHMSMQKLAYSVITEKSTKPTGSQSHVLLYVANITSKTNTGNAIKASDFFISTRSSLLQWNVASLVST